MGITSQLADTSKWIVIALMFLGRVGPLSLLLGLSGKWETEPMKGGPKEDLAV